MTEQTQERYTAPSPPPKDAAAAIAWVYSQVGYVQKVKGRDLAYSFAGEAELIAALRPAMVAVGLIAYVSSILDLRQDTYTTKNGAVMNHATAIGVVSFEHPPSSTRVQVQACGEGSDVSDKAVNKSMTGMLKYALRQTFLIETGDDPDGSHPEDRGSASTSRRTSRSRPAAATRSTSATTKRSAKTSVLVKNGDTVVLGGMMQETFTNNALIDRWALWAFDQVDQADRAGVVANAEAVPAGLVGVHQ